MRAGGTDRALQRTAARWTDLSHTKPAMLCDSYRSALSDTLSNKANKPTGLDPPEAMAPNMDPDVDGRPLLLPPSLPLLLPHRAAAAAPPTPALTGRLLDEPMLFPAAELTTPPVLQQPLLLLRLLGLL